MRILSFLFNTLIKTSFLLGMLAVLGILSLLASLGSGGKAKHSSTNEGWIGGSSLIPQVYADNPHQSTQAECSCEGGSGGCSSCEGSY